MIDLHLHSIFSDGLDNPSELIDKAVEKSLKAIALTDHDSIDGISEFISYGENKDIIVIPGVEISIKNDIKRELINIHVIGLNIDWRSLKLNSNLKKQLDGRIKQKKAIIEKLNDEFGYSLTFNEVKALAGGKVIGRPHIVQALVNNNPEKTKDISREELFEMMSYGGQAHVERKFELSLEETIEIIKDADGTPILAHPGVYRPQDFNKFLKIFLKAGIKGIEVEYPYDKNRPWLNSGKEQWAQTYYPNFFKKFAEKNNLITSGGSDYHGGTKGISLGDLDVPDDYIKSFLG